MNAELGRLVLDHVTAHREQLNMGVWGELDSTPCGTSACLAGWTLIFSGWELVEDDTFRKLSDGYETDRPDVLADEARKLLNLSDDEFWREDDLWCLFNVRDDIAVEWLRELVEKAEANRVT